MIRYSSSQNIADTQSKALILMEALPFLRRFVGSRILVKVGGEILLDKRSAVAFAQDIVLLNSIGIKVTVCHGGGPQISQLMRNTGEEPQFIHGQRVTDSDDLDTIAYALVGQVNRDLVSLINTYSSQAIGLSGFSGNILTVSQLNKDLGFVGRVEHVRSDPLVRLLDADYIPVISSLGTDGNGQTYNVNADSAAGEIARALRAEKLVILTNTEGLYEDFKKRERLISEIDTASLEELHERNIFSEGMIPKIDSVLTALRGGVSSAHILDGRTEHALLLEFFTQEGIGTMVYP